MRKVGIERGRAKNEHLFFRKALHGYLLVSSFKRGSSMGRLTLPY
jgi:hypothetical protein